MDLRLSVDGFEVVCCDKKVRRCENRTTQPSENACPESLRLSLGGKKGRLSINVDNDSKRRLIYDHNDHNNSNDAWEGGRGRPSLQCKSTSRCG